MDKFGLIGKIPGVATPLQYEDFFLDGDDFVTTPVDDEDYAFTNATAGTMALDPAAANGVLLLDSNSTTVTQGAQIQRPAASFLPVAGRTIWFETRLKLVDTYDDCQFFAGLAEIDTTIIGSSAVSTANHIAFTCVTNDGILLSNAEKAGANTTGVGTTLAEDTWVVLGIKVNGLTDITYYVDGVAVNKITTVANIPIVAMAPSFVCQTGGTADVIMHIDYWKCQQTR